VPVAEPVEVERSVWVAVVVAALTVAAELGREPVEVERPVWVAVVAAAQAQAGQGVVWAAVGQSALPS
jgi:hypothetical protein